MYNSWDDFYTTGTVMAYLAYKAQFETDIMGTEKDNRHVQRQGIGNQGISGGGKG
jgi:hypothetical protein